jgi:hypothetical protein
MHFELPIVPSIREFAVTIAQRFNAVALMV